MQISRRDFLKYCGLTAAALGLSSTELLRLEEALANPSAPTVLWLQGASCTGCSMSFLNYISPTAPTSAADILINNINLAYHPNIMTMSGQGAADVAEQAYNAGGYILAVEGGVPTAFGGRTCWAWNYNGVDVTFQQAVTDLASNASIILSIGTCAAFGGIPAAGPNPTKIKSVKAVTGKNTINIAGCPANPDWTVYTIVQLLTGGALPLDANGRPTAIYGATVHSTCPLKNDPERCLSPRGCRGPGTFPGPIEQALIGTPVKDLNQPVEVVRVIHSFDPCLSCAVHVMRPDAGKKIFTLAHYHGGEEVHAHGSDHRHHHEHDHEQGHGRAHNYHHEESLP